MKIRANRLVQAMLARRSLAVIAVAILVAPPVTAQSVIDGDSIEFGGTTYRLHGIDAPDPSQICADGWPAGYAAEEYLGKLVAGRQITCMPTTGEGEDEDENKGESKGKMVAICRADGVDLGAAMVTGGYAFAFVPYSARYISQEASAVSAHRGVHRHKCLSPWEWRARLKRAP